MQSESVTLIINQSARDAALVNILTQLRVIRTLVGMTYQKVYDLTPEETETAIQELTSREFDEVFLFLAKFGDLDVEGLREQLNV